tara:strand:- start:2661 stop:4214 length:1554 start_codon:yes stop_codon:yes gene_type:complete
MIFKITKEELKDKILGGWTGKSYGAMMGEPMEFHAQGAVYRGSLDIQPEAPKTWLHKEDDLYTNMAFLEIMRDKGLSASQDDFSNIFRKSKFMLWHANGQARQNLLEGIKPGLSGHPKYNPHADDIDFQIECDFIGIVSPGLAETSQDIANKVGHIMNYGDGYYAGAFLTALYTYSFIDNDIVSIIQKAKLAIPENCNYSLIINDLLSWYDENPDDWELTWKKLENKWNYDLCPWTKSDPPTIQDKIVGKFNIQGHFNGAYILLGLLYGKGDYLESIKICTRCGQDTDSNVANCGGIMGVITGYQDLPNDVKNELTPYMDRDYYYTSLSINSASDLSYDLAIKNILNNGGKIDNEQISIKTQQYVFNGDPEVSFNNLSFKNIFTVHPDLSPEIKLNGSWEKHERFPDFFVSNKTGDFIEVEFSGSCIYMQGNLHECCGILNAYIDGELLQTRDMYTRKEYNDSSQCTAVWITNIPDTKHILKVEVSGKKRKEALGTEVQLGRVISYTGSVTEPDTNY